MDYSSYMAKRRSYDFFDEELLGRLRRLHLVAKRLTTRQRSGVRRSRRIGDGLEFADHRAYAPGDDIRFIDWPYYARMEKLLLRLFHEHSESEVAILFDVSDSMSPGGAREKFDYCRRAAAALAYVAMGSLERVALYPFADDLGDPMHAGRRRDQVFDVLDFLADVRPGGRTNLSRSIERFIDRCDSAATVLLISDLLDCSEELSGALAMLRHRQCATTVLHVYSPADAEPNLAGPMLLRQAETLRQMNLNVTGELLASYRRCWLAFRAGCERICLLRGATYVAAETNLPFEHLLLQTLRQAGVLAG